MLKHLGIAVLACAVLAAGCGGGDQAAETTVAEKAVNVEVYPVEPTTFVDYLSLPVVVIPNREVSIGLVQGGRVVTINVDKGDRVRQNQVLLTTDTETLRANLRTAEANLEYQKSEFERNRKLLESGSITEAVFDASKLQLAQAQSAYEIAKKQLDDATLEAPFSGVVTERNVEVGDILSPGAPAFRIIDMDRVKVQAGIPERYITDFKLGNDVAIMFDAFQGETFQGRISFIAPEASPQTRTFLTEILVENRDGQIRAGIMGNARIQQQTYSAALLVPLDALIETQEGRKLFVVRDDSLAAERSVTLGRSTGDMIMITSGLQPGDKVITKGQHNLVDGEDIRITGQYEGPVAGEVNPQ